MRTWRAVECSLCGCGMGCGMCGLGQWLQDEGGRDQLGQAINCPMFAFLSLLRVRKGLIHFPQSSLALSTSAERKHGWVENQTFNQLWGWGGVNLGEYQSWARGGGWTCCALRPGTKSLGWVLFVFAKEALQNSEKQFSQHGPNGGLPWWLSLRVTLLVAVSIRHLCESVLLPE